MAGRTSLTIEDICFVCKQPTLYLIYLKSGTARSAAYKGGIHSLTSRLLQQLELRSLTL
jgi:hypothetical protein